jgi:hypothetical protein
MAGRSLETAQPSVFKNIGLLTPCLHTALLKSRHTLKVPLHSHIDVSPNWQCHIRVLKQSMAKS